MCSSTSYLFLAFWFHNSRVTNDFSVHETRLIVYKIKGLVSVLSFLIRLWNLENISLSFSLWLIWSDMDSLVIWRIVSFSFWLYNASPFSSTCRSLAFRYLALSVPGKLKSRNLLRRNLSVNFYTHQCTKSKPYVKKIMRLCALTW